MSIDRLTRVNELIKREIGEKLYSVMVDPGFDMAAITVTHVMTSRNLRRARVLISILGHEDQREHILSQIRRHRSELQRLINSDLKLKYTPRLSFDLDTSLEKGDHILDVLTRMEDEGALPEDDGSMSHPRETEGDAPCL